MNSSGRSPYVRTQLYSFSQRDSIDGKKTYLTHLPMKDSATKLCDRLSRMPLTDQGGQRSRVCVLRLVTQWRLINKTPTGTKTGLTLIHTSFAVVGSRRMTVLKNSLDALFTQLITLWFSHDLSSRKSVQSPIHISPQELFPLVHSGSSNSVNTSTSSLEKDGNNPSGPAAFAH